LSFNNSAKIKNKLWEEQAVSLGKTDRERLEDGLNLDGGKTFLCIFIAVSVNYRALFLQMTKHNAKRVSNPTLQKVWKTCIILTN
jgi:hypothetical protein